MISVIIPVYNTGNYLERCIDSVLASHYEDFELILIDDGSVDHSASICREYCKTDSRIRYFRQEHKGVSAARNKGLDESRGTWILFIDSDDFIFPGLLDMVADKAYEGQELLLFDFMRLGSGSGIPDKKEAVPEEGARIDYGEKDRLHMIKCLLNMEKLDKKGSANLAFSWTKAYKKSVIDQYQIRFSEELAISEDKLFNLEYILKMKSCTYIRRKVYFWAAREGSATQGFIPEFLPNDIQYQKKLRSFLEDNGIFSELKTAYYSNVLSNMANILIRGIFHPCSTRTWQENCRQCEEMQKVEHYGQAKKYNGQAGNLPRKVLLYFYYRKKYYIVKQICAVSFWILKTAGRLS